MADAPNNVHQLDRAALLARIGELEAMLDALPMKVAELVQGGEPLLSVKGVAYRLNVSERTVRTLIADGELRPIPIRGQHRFHPEAIDAYIAACARRSVA